MLVTVSAMAPPAIYANASPTPTPVATPAVEESSRGSVAVYSEYDSRFADIFSNLAAHLDLGAGMLAPYAALDVDYDTRSGVPGVSEIYNDDAVVMRAGYRLALDPGRYASLFATGGYSFGLRSQASFPETRYGIEYAREFGSERPGYPSTTLSGDVTAYSRYQGNVIGEGDLAYEAPVAGPLRVLGGTDFSLDDQREYGNNYVEAYGGLNWRLSRTLVLQGTGVVGEYLSRGVDVPNPRSYTTLRVRLQFDDTL